MITVVTEHWTVPEQKETAENLIRENGKTMRAFAGFVSRVTLVSQADPYKVTSVTTWRSPDDYAAWNNRPRPERPAGQADAPRPQLWTTPPETEVYTLVPEL